jgi:molecular chaperone HtpG
VDAFWTVLPVDVDGKPFKSLSQGDVDFSLIPLTEQDARSDDEAKLELEGVDEAGTIAAIKESLGDRVSDVRASRRLTDSASCLVAGGAGPDRHLERLIARQGGGAGGLSRPILEVNMRHPIACAVSTAKAAGHDDEVGDLGALLLDQARILDGESPDDPADFVRRLNRLVVRGFAA